jgi:hypothetical protein
MGMKESINIITEEAQGMSGFHVVGNGGPLVMNKGLSEHGDLSGH